MSRRTTLALAGAVLVALIVVLLVLLVPGSDKVRRGTDQRGAVTPPKGSTLVSVRARAANDYDPLGDDSEHGSEAPAVVDGDATSTWSTESYQGGTLAGKAGVGIYIDARPSVVASLLEVRSPTPGFTAEVYGSLTGPPKEIGGWTKLADARSYGRAESIDLANGGKPYRYYLLWITALPENATSVQISELALARKSTG